MEIGSCENSFPVALILRNFIANQIAMEHKKELEELHKKSLDKIDALIDSKKNLTEDHHEKLKEAKKKMAGFVERFDGCADVFGDAGNLIYFFNTSSNNL